MKLPPASRAIFRGSLTSNAANGHLAFIPQVRKLVFEYCDHWPSNANTRTFLLNDLENMARKNPHVEFVVKRRPWRQPIVRGFYLNDRTKVITLHDLEVTGISQKVQLLLDSSGAKIKSLKRNVVESTTPAARGIWSGMHVEPYQI